MRVTPTCTRLSIWTAVGLLALAVLGGCAAATADPVSLIAPDETLALLDERDDVVVIDVRTPEEHAEGHVAGARLLDLAGGVFQEQVGDLDREATYVLYCRTGNRSAQAAAMMDELGFHDVRDAGAYDDLAAAGVPTGG